MTIELVEPSEPVEGYVPERNGQVWPRHPKCGTVWRQSGNRTGHCANCCRTFDGITAFDRHQRHDGPKGKLQCHDPLELMDEGAPYRIRIGDGVFDKGVIYYRLEVGSFDEMKERLGL